MGNRQKMTSHITGFLREFATIFTLAILAFSLVGKLVANADTELHGVTTIHTLDGTGLPYITIIQLLAFSFIMAFISRIISSDFITSKLKLIWRSLIFTLSAFFTTVIFSVLFKWFPVNNIHAWLSFIPAFFGCYAIAIGLSFLLMKQQDKKYNKLLEKFKKEQNVI